MIDSTALAPKTDIFVQSCGFSVLFDIWIDRNIFSCIDNLRDGGIWLQSSLCVCVCAFPLWDCVCTSFTHTHTLAPDVCTGWQIADRHWVQQQVMGGGSRLSPSLALSSNRSASILFSSCQNSQPSIDSSLLHLTLCDNTQSHNRARAEETSCRWIGSKRKTKQVYWPVSSAVNFEYIHSRKGQKNPSSKASEEFNHL